MMESGRGMPSTKDLALKMYETINKDELDRLDEVVSDDVVLEWPQSCERVRGLRHLKAILGNYPGGRLQPRYESARVVQGDEAQFVLTPMFTMVRVEGTGDTAFTAVKSCYPDGTEWYIVAIVTAHDGKLVKLVQYFAPVYDAPEWRQKWVETME